MKKNHSWNIYPGQKGSASQVLGKKNNQVKPVGRKNSWVVVDKQEVFEGMYGKPLNKDEHSQMVKEMRTQLFAPPGTIAPQKPPSKYGDDDFSVPEGTNISFDM